MNELRELEKLDGEIHLRKAEMARLEDQQKILAKEAALLNRRQRTRRLCIRGGMLESFLGVPELLRAVFKIFCKRANCDAQMIPGA